MSDRGTTSSWLVFILRAFYYTRLKFASGLKLAIGWPFMALAFAVMIVILIILLPSRIARIKACNHFGTVVGGFFVWLSGCPLTVTGAERLDPSKPAIFASNHTSVLDIFIAIWKSPTGTVGVAKKEIIYYPFFGLLYALSGHLRIDRGDSKKAIASMKKMAEIVKKHNLSIFIWPEGTRSRDGRLMPFKKGFANMAIQTGLPVVPFVVSGAYKSWEKRTHTIKPVPIKLDVLPPMDSSKWTTETIDEYIEAIHEQFRKTLPSDQQPHPKLD